MKKLTALGVAAMMVLYAGLALAAPLSGKVTEWKGGKEFPLAGAIVVIGKNISLDTSKIDDTVKNSANVAKKVTTDEKGMFKVDIPAGKYAIILWKSKYVPYTGVVTVPGDFLGSISVDNQVGASGRHRYLQYDR